jgi:hypothetical protein
VIASRDKREATTGRRKQEGKGAALMRYAVVIEKAAGNYAAYVPDGHGPVDQS